MSNPASIAIAPNREPATPTRTTTSSYVIATAPRTGSSLFADGLTATKRAGAPDEFFDVHAANEANWVNRFRIPAGASYIDHLEQATRTPNGVFGFKLHWHQMPALSRRLLETRPVSESLSNRPLFEMLRERFPDIKFIWLTRRNKVAQAISYYRASETNVWRAWNDERPMPTATDTEPEYNRAGIERHLRMVNNMDAGWRRFFVTHKIPALILLYEDFVAAYARTIQTSLTYLGLPTDGLTFPPPALRRLSDDQSLEWEERFRREMAPAAAPVPAPVAKAPAVAPVAAPDVAAEPADLSVIAYDVGSPMKTDVVPGGPTRAWMNATPNRFAYRCLPMVIANQWGWMIQTRHRVEAVWDGTQSPAGVKIVSDGPEPSVIASSHFGSGVLTFHVGFLFCTPPGFNIHVRGPANWPKDGIYALEGIVETDWIESTFTMNWKFTRPNHPVVFEAGEPVAMISLVPRGQMEQFVPEILPLSSNPERHEKYMAWSKSRNQFNADLTVPGSEAKKVGWQKDYTRGRTVTGDAAPEHQTAIELRPFADKR